VADRSAKLKFRWDEGNFAAAIPNICSFIKEALSPALRTLSHPRVKPEDRRGRIPAIAVLPPPCHV